VASGRQELAQDRAFNRRQAAQMTDRPGRGYWNDEATDSESVEATRMESFVRWPSKMLKSKA